jgi:hypothetical protein
MDPIIPFLYVLEGRAMHERDQSIREGRGNGNVVIIAVEFAVMQALGKNFEFRTITPPRKSKEENQKVGSSSR